MRYILDTIRLPECPGWKVEVHYDEDCASPREHENVTQLICSHKRYDLGDEGHGINFDDYSSWDEVKAAIYARAADANDSVLWCASLFLYDHSGITMRMGSNFADCDPGQWDSGQVGWCVITKKRAEEIGIALDAESVRKAAECEVQEYVSYIENDCWGYVVKDHNGKKPDDGSCWGFIGSDYAKQEATNALRSEYNRYHEQERATDALVNRGFAL